MYEEKDWIMRQIKQLAEGLGAMLSKDSIKNILSFEQTDTQQISDEDLEKIIAIVDAKQKKEALHLSDEVFCETIGINEDDWLEIDSLTKLPDDTNYQLIKDFINH